MPPKCNDWVATRVDELSPDEGQEPAETLGKIVEFGCNNKKNKLLTIQSTQCWSNLSYIITF